MLLLRRAVQIYAIYVDGAYQSFAKSAGKYFRVGHSSECG